MQKVLAMSNALLEYLNKRFQANRTYISEFKIPGPVITISREVGCNGVDTARKVAERLNRRHLRQEWKVLSKEIFYESAKELDMEPEKVISVFKYPGGSSMKDILNAFGTKKFKSEKKVIKTVNEVIHSFAEEGFCIIVGRAGHIIARDIKNSLHIKSVAPFDYRINSVMNKKQSNREEAVEFIDKVEKERKLFRKAISKEASEDDIFDLYINVSVFNTEQVLDLIETAAEKKRIFCDYSKQIDFY